jgi:hypothetical protein
MKFVLHQAMKSGMKPRTVLQKSTKGTKMCSPELGPLQEATEATEMAAARSPLLTPLPPVQREF